jgi:putative flavoprotein involved in K+ transport
VIDVVVVGAGHAGLAMSWHLARRGIDHPVLEAGRVGGSWRSRWDSFALDTPTWTVQMPPASPCR